MDDFIRDRFDFTSDRQLQLIGHSQGGLIIQEWLVQRLHSGEGEKLRPLRQVMFIATPTLDFRELGPDDGVLVLHPERALDIENFTRFMKAGGRVVLLDDYGRGDALLRHFGMERVPIPHRPAG